MVGVVIGSRWHSGSFDGLTHYPEVHTLPLGLRKQIHNEIHMPSSAFSKSSKKLMEQKMTNRRKKQCI